MRKSNGIFASRSFDGACRQKHATEAKSPAAKVNRFIISPLRGVGRSQVRIRMLSLTRDSDNHGNLRQLACARQMGSATAIRGRRKFNQSQSSAEYGAGGSPEDVAARLLRHFQIQNLCNLNFEILRQI